MICPNCSAEYESFHLFCHQCGCALPQPQDSQPAAEELETETVPAADTAPVPDEPVIIDGDYSELYSVTPVSQKKGRHWPAVVIMAILTAIGIGLFFVIPMPQTDTPSQNSCYIIENGVLDFYEMYYTGGSTLTVPETVDGQTVTALADYCFMDCDSLTEIILPDTLESVGECAFFECSNLRGIKIPDNVSEIGDWAFEDCTALEAVSIPSSVMKVGKGAFDGCDKLRHLFYSGNGERWFELYPKYINEEVSVYAADGIYTYDD